jgi:excisionase family DNA binding protein
VSDNVIPIAKNRAVYTVTETAQLLSLSRGTTYGMVRRGEIPARKIGDRWVIPKERFHTWLNDIADGGDAEAAEALDQIGPNPKENR